MILDGLIRKLEKLKVSDGICWVTPGEPSICGSNYTVDWPKGKKAAEKDCEETYEGQVHMDDLGNHVRTFQSCKCEKAN